MLFAAIAVFALGAVALAGLVWVGVPSRAPYKYIELDTPGLSVRERYKPGLSLYLGEEIPRVYEGSLGAETLVIADVEDAYTFVPALSVSGGASQVLTVEDLEPSCAHQVRESEREVVVWWGTCAAIGARVGFVVRLESGAALPVRGGRSKRRYVYRLGGAVGTPMLVPRRTRWVSSSRKPIGPTSAAGLESETACLTRRY